ncbi:unnamed protein product, partial [Urochloa humidicola]
IGPLISQDRDGTAPIPDAVKNVATGYWTERSEITRIACAVDFSPPWPPSPSPPFPPGAGTTGGLRSRRHRRSKGVRLRGNQRRGGPPPRSARCGPARRRQTAGRTKWTGGKRRVSRWPEVMWRSGSWSGSRYGRGRGAPRRGGGLEAGGGPPLSLSQPILAAPCFPALSLVRAPPPRLSYCRRRRRLPRPCLACLFLFAANCSILAISQHLARHAGDG